MHLLRTMTPCCDGVALQDSRLLSYAFSIQRGSATVVAPNPASRPAFMLDVCHLVLPVCLPFNWSFILRERVFHHSLAKTSSKDLSVEGLLVILPSAFPA